MPHEESRRDLVPGTLEMLILNTLARAPMHGYAIAQYIQKASEEALRVEEGSLYPALQRLLIKGWARAEWRETENRRLRVYHLTNAGRKQLGIEIADFERRIRAITRVLRPSEG